MNACMHPKALSFRMRLYRRKYVYIWCKKCEGSTMHAPVVSGERRNLTLQHDFKCVECGNIFHWKKTDGRSLR